MGVEGGAITGAAENADEDDDDDGRAEVPTKFDRAARTCGERGTGIGDDDEDALVPCEREVLPRLPDTDPLRLRTPPLPPLPALAIISALPKCMGDGCGVKGACACTGGANMGKADEANSPGDWCRWASC